MNNSIHGIRLVITSIILGVILYILSKNALESNEQIVALILVITSTLVTMIGFVAATKFYKLNIGNQNGKNRYSKK